MGACTTARLRSDRLRLRFLLSQISTMTNYQAATRHSPARSDFPAGVTSTPGQTRHNAERDGAGAYVVDGSTSVAPVEESARRANVKYLK